MIRKVFKTGNSSVISLPREYLDTLDIGNGSEVNVELDRSRNRLIITPVPKPGDLGGVDTDFARQVAEFADKFRPVLVALEEDE